MRIGVAVLAPAPGVGARTTDMAAPAFGTRLREVRLSLGLTLHKVEATTSGEFKASALSAYERGDRIISVARLARLAAVYNVSVATLVSEDVIDLSVQHAIDVSSDQSENLQLALRELVRFAAYVRFQRGVPVLTPLTIRARDVDLLGVVLGHRPDRVREMLERVGVRAPERSSLAR